MRPRTTFQQLIGISIFYRFGHFPTQEQVQIYAHLLSSTSQCNSFLSPSANAFQAANLNSILCINFPVFKSSFTSVHKWERKGEVTSRVNQNSLWSTTGIMAKDATSLLCRPHKLELIYFTPHFFSFTRNMKQFSKPPPV